MNTFSILHGDAIEQLRTLPDNSVHCCVTSPPYWGLRDYGHAGQIGLEQTPDEYVGRLVEVFREVRRVLRDDGTVWLNLGDSYARTTPNHGLGGGKLQPGLTPDVPQKTRMATGFKDKDLVGIPWRVAFALQADGWWLRQDIIWHKPNPMPESVRDRCTKAHEYVFLLTKSARYFYDADAVSEPSVDPEGSAKRYEYGFSGRPDVKITPNDASGHRIAPQGMRVFAPTRNRRSVWTVTTQPFSGAHFATMPPELAETCIRAGCPVDGTVLDPFCGSGTTLAVAIANGRNGIGIELSAAYIELAMDRITGTQPALLGV